LKNTGLIVQFDSANKNSAQKDTKKMTRSISSMISYSLVYGMLIFLVTIFALITFLFLLDLNQLRKEYIEQDMISHLFDESNPIIEKVDYTVKPYLKRFLKSIHYNTNIPYVYDGERFKNMTTLQAINDFGTSLNISNASDFIALIQNSTFESSHGGSSSEDYYTTYSLIDSENEYIRLFNKIYTMIRHVLMDIGSDEINTGKIFEILKMILQYLFAVIMELSNYSFYFIVFLS